MIKHLLRTLPRDTTLDHFHRHHSDLLRQSPYCLSVGAVLLFVENLLYSRKIKNTKKLYLMTTNKILFYSQFDFEEVSSQNLLIREI